MVEGGGSVDVVAVVAGVVSLQAAAVSRSAIAPPPRNRRLCTLRTAARASSCSRAGPHAPALGERVHASIAGARRSCFCFTCASSRSWNSGSTSAREQLQRLADVLVLVASRLAHEDQLVDADVLVVSDEVADLVGRTDRAAQRTETLLEQLCSQGLLGL